MRVCANLFDIVNTGQHPDASVVEDGELFCQFLLAGLDHSPRHLPFAVKSPESIQKNSSKSPQNLVRKKEGGEKEREAEIYGVIRCRPCSDIRGQQLPVLHPTVSLPLFFFFFRSPG